MFTHPFSRGVTRDSGRFLAALLLLVLAPMLATAQTGGTGVLSGTVTDPSGRVLPAVQIDITSETTSFTRTLESNQRGFYIAPLLPPGDYTITATYANLAPLTTRHIHVSVSAQDVLDLHLSTVVAVQQLSITAEKSGEVDLNSPAGGAVTSRELVTNLPLSSRNYTQIIGLNTGVAAEIANAGALGRGDTSYSAGPTGFSSNGAGTNDNNFQMNGADINDIEGGAFISRGIPVPNPDAIEEFRVSTQPYDASFGRNAGANVNLVTRSGTASIHGSAFEYFRNDALNANTYFRNATAQPRGALKQNQFGGALSGPITPKVLAFGSYQESRQSNGIDITCAGSVSLPPFTNDRSPSGLGAVFAGQRGYFQNAFGGVGPAIAADGSNISPVALAILQKKNADGTYLIPTPQVIASTSGPFDARGFSTFSLPCSYTEHQGIVNADWQPTERSHTSFRAFVANSGEAQTLPLSLIGGSQLPSSPYHISDRFRSASISHTYVISNNFFNQFEFGFNRVGLALTQGYPFSFSSVGSSVPNFDDALPVLDISNVAIGGQGEAFTGAINTFFLQNTLAYTRGRHFIHFGGGITRIQENQPEVQFHAAAVFLQFSDFLLGQNATQNGTAAVCAFYGCGAGYSDIAYAGDLAGKSQREYRVLSGNIYAQDDFRLTPRFTLNFGLRYERLGDFSDRLGHNVSFFPALADPNPPASGSVQGYVVQANYPGAVPQGVTRLSNNYGINGDGQNTWQPRAGASWRLPFTERLVLHAGYGIFRSRLTGDPYNQSSVSPPFALLRQYQGTDPVSASLNLAQPLPPVAINLPAFTPYCPPTAPSCNLNPQVFNGFAADVEPPFYQHYSADIKTSLTPTLTFDIGYAGARGTHLVTEKFTNQAALASPSNPIRGVTTNTLANLPFRVPVPGFTTNNLGIIETSGSSWYNSLQTSLHKQTTRTGELLISYTWARLLADAYGGSAALHGGTLLGNQQQSTSSYGPDSFLREHRIVVSYLFNIPSPHEAMLRKTLGNWHISGVTTAQSGHRLSATYQNQFSVYGVKNDRAQLVSGCNPTLAGSAETRLTTFFRTSCFTTPPVIGDDHTATGFGNSPLGLITGPRQVNVDAALVRTFPLSPWRETASINFRAEAYNLFNHPQFQDPDTELTSATFGQVRSTTGSSRIIQLALNLHF